MGPWLLLAVGCGEPVELPDPTTVGPAPPTRALVLVVDGVRTDELCTTTPSDVTGISGEEMAPGLWATVAPDGVVSRNALATGATITAPAHAALLTGRPEAYANLAMDGGPGLYRPLLPTLFEAVRELGVGADEVVLAANTQLLEGLTHSVRSEDGATWALVPDPADASTASDDAGVLDAVRRRIDAGPPRLLVVNLHDVDRAGHHADAPEYPSRVTDVDAEIARLWTWIRAEHPAYAASLLFVVTADHGRHRPGGGEAWRNHGDACLGCRELPLFLVGGGALAGTELDVAPIAADLTPTLAAHLGVTMPWATGLPLLGGAARTGEIALSRSGGLVATQVWRADPLARSEIVVDGAVVSTPGTLAAESPTVLDGAVDVACWRELAEVDDALPWVPRCAVRDGGWTDIGFPVDEVGPFWEVALVERDGAVWAAWPENPQGAAEAAGTGLALASWTAAAGWSAPLLVAGDFPTDVALASTDDGLVAAFGTNLPDPGGRHTRRVRIVAFTVTAGVAADTGATDLAEDGARVELGALAAGDGYVRAAMVILDEHGARIAATSGDGRTFGAPVTVPSPGVPAAHLAPAWDGDEVVWVAEDAGDSLLCRATPGDADARCVSVGSPRVDSFVVTPGGATVIRDTSTATWARAEVTW